MGNQIGAIRGLTQTSSSEETPAIIERSTHRTSAEADLCALCLSRHLRERKAECTCSHCPLPLCSDCMRDHRSELPQNITQLTQKLHRLEELFREKQNMVREEVSQSTAEVKQYIRNCQHNLSEAYDEIRDDITNAKQDAERYLSTVQLELETIRTDIDTLAAEPTYQPRPMETLLTQLNQIQENLQTYKATKDPQLNVVMPKYKLQFQHISTPTNNITESSLPQSSNTQNNTRKRKSNNEHKSQRRQKASVNGRTKNTLPDDDDDADDTETA